MGISVPFLLVILCLLEEYRSFLEADAAQTNKALNETLTSLPDDTKVFSGHEYTKSDVNFLLAISDSDAIKKLQAFAESNKQTQGILTIGDEKVRNVFMKLRDPDILKKTANKGPVGVMDALRELKNAM